LEGHAVFTEVVVDLRQAGVVREGGRGRKTSNRRAPEKICMRIPAVRMGPTPAVVLRGVVVREGT
jgi:hypothetical protein